MPIKKVKCKINNSTKHSNNNYESSQHQSKNLIDLITRISQASKNRSKSQSNLPARLMMMKNMSKKNSINSPIIRPMMHSMIRPMMRPIMRPITHMNPMKMNIMQKPQSYSKTISSTYSDVMENGHSHSEGKKVINDSTKPYVQIDELHNGHIEHYMVPRNIMSTKPTETIINISTHNPMILDNQTITKKKKSKTSKKTTKSKKSKISKKSKKTTKSKKSKTSKKTAKSNKSKTSKKSTKSK